MNNRIFKFIMVKLCGEPSETPQEEETFFRRMRGWLDRTFGKKVHSSEDAEQPGGKDVINPGEEKTALQADEQTVQAQPKLTAEEKYQRRQARRTERRREAEKAKFSQVTTKNGIRLLPDDTNIVKEMTGEVIAGIEPPIHEAVLEKEADASSDLDLKVPKNGAKIKLRNITQEDLLRADLHGDTRDEIDWKISALIRDGKNLSQKFVLIITGKGYNSQNGKPVIRPAVQQLLIHYKRQGTIKEFITAPAHMGGRGAFVVILK